VVAILAALLCLYAALRHTKVGAFAKSAISMTWPGLIMIILSIFVAPFMHFTTKELMWLTFLLVGQNASFTLVSRSRQSNNFVYHAIASVGSNGLYILVQMSVIMAVMSSALRGATNWPLVGWYTVCTVVGSVYMHWLAVKKIEQKAGLKKDTGVSHKELEDILAARLREVYERLDQVLIDAAMAKVEPYRLSAEEAFALATTSEAPDDLPPADVWPALETFTDLPTEIAASESEPRVVESGPVTMTMTALAYALAVQNTGRNRFANLEPVDEGANA